jgi:hypothetical protein
MHSLLALAAPLALILPVLAPGDQAGARLANTGSASGLSLSAPQCDSAAQQGPAAVANPLAAMRSGATVRQVRIEQRVVVRIAPQPPAARANMLAELPQRELAPRFEERGREKCVSLTGIAGVQTGSGNRLVLFLRDRRMLSVNLGKACRARDFYSGFYVEKNRDGKLCIERDLLQSRSGARCEVASMRQLVEVRE